MKAVIDANILLDVLQKRSAHFLESANVLAAAEQGHFTPLLPAHLLPTIFYVLRKASGMVDGEKAVDWLLQTFEVHPTTADLMRRARGLQFPDFEDGLVAATAEEAGCSQIITRNLNDFKNSPIPAMTAGDFLTKLMEDR